MLKVGRGNKSAGKGLRQIHSLMDEKVQLKKPQEHSADTTTAGYKTGTLNHEIIDSITFAFGNIVKSDIHRPCLNESSSDSIPL